MKEECAPIPKKRRPISREEVVFNRKFVGVRNIQK